MSVHLPHAVHAPLYEQDKNPRPLPVVEPGVCLYCNGEFARQLMYVTPSGRYGTKQLLCEACYRRRWRMT